MNQKQITIVTAIIRDKKERFLLSKRNEPSLPYAHNKWQFIGGGINFGEDPEASIVRECKEEAGIKIVVVKMLPKIFTHL